MKVKATLDWQGAWCQRHTTHTCQSISRSSSQLCVSDHKQLGAVGCDSGLQQPPAPEPSASKLRLRSHQPPAPQPGSVVSIWRKISGHLGICFSGFCGIICLFVIILNCFYGLNIVLLDQSDENFFGPKWLNILWTKVMKYFWDQNDQIFLGPKLSNIFGSKMMKHFWE